MFVNTLKFRASRQIVRCKNLYVGLTQNYTGLHTFSFLYQRFFTLTNSAIHLQAEKYVSPTIHVKKMAYFVSIGSISNTLSVIRDSNKGPKRYFSAELHTKDILINVYCSPLNFA